MRLVDGKLRLAATGPSGQQRPASARAGVADLRGDNVPEQKGGGRPVFKVGEVVASEFADVAVALDTSASADRSREA
jgi:hypothetical protein